MVYAASGSWASVPVAARYSSRSFLMAAALFKTISKSVEKESDIKWNFTKFLISRDGSVIKRFPPTITPEEMEQDLQAMIG